MLHINNLDKKFGDYVVFQGLTHTFTPGCFALCEEDSTGKSTLLGIIAGTIKPDRGKVLIDGVSLSESPMQAKLSVAYVPDDCLQFPTITGRELLEQTAQERNTTVGDAALVLADKLGLTPHLDKQFEQMSKGTRRKVYLCAAAIGQPCVIVADGPTIGLDAPASAALAEQYTVWGRNRVVLFASHDPDFVRAVDAKAINIGNLRES